MQSLNMIEPNTTTLLLNRSTEGRASVPALSDRNESFEVQLQEASTESKPERDDHVDVVEADKEPVDAFKEKRPEQGASDKTPGDSEPSPYTPHIAQAPEVQSQSQEKPMPVENAKHAALDLAEQDAVPNSVSPWKPNLEAEGGLFEASVSRAATALDTPEKLTTAQGSIASSVLPSSGDAKILEDLSPGANDPATLSLKVLPEATEGHQKVATATLATKTIPESPNNINASDPIKSSDLATDGEEIDTATRSAEQKMASLSSTAVKPGVALESESTSILGTKAVLASASPDAQSQSNQNQMSFDKGSGFSFSQGNAASSVTQTAVSQTTTSFQARLDGILQAPDETQVLRQVATQLRGFRAGQNESLRFLLDPKELGRIQIDVVFHEEGVRAHFLTSDPAVKELLEGNQAYLKQNLADQGLHMSSFSVDVGDMAESEEQKAAFEEASSGKREEDRAQGQDEPEGASEVLKVRAARTRGKSQVSVYV